METLKKIGTFVLLFVGLMGAISAPIALATYHSWLPMIGSLVVDAFAVKPFKSLIQKLLA